MTLSHRQKPQPDKVGVAVALFSTYAVWGATFLGMRIALEGLPPFLMAGSRFVITGGGLLLILRSRGEPWPIRRQWGGAGVAGRPASAPTRRVAEAI